MYPASKSFSPTKARSYMITPLAMLILKKTLLPLTQITIALPQSPKLSRVLASMSSKIGRKSISINQSFKTSCQNSTFKLTQDLLKSLYSTLLTMKLAFGALSATVKIPCFGLPISTLSKRLSRWLLTNLSGSWRISQVSNIITATSATACLVVLLREWLVRPLSTLYVKNLT